MPIRTFELFHGAVLTKLVRGDHPVTLRLIETRPSDLWSTYRVNDELNLLLKYSTSPKSPKSEKGVMAWQLVFSSDQMKQLAIPGTWAALVCGSRELRSNEMEICLLDAGQLAQLLNLDLPWPHSLHVRRVSNKGLRVGPTKAGRDMVVARNRLEKWTVPGS
jgi:hypothetical protein